MYCEIFAKHGKPVVLDDLKRLIGEKLGNPISLEDAYRSSALYSRFPPRSSVLAFETVLNCFIILRSVNLDFCTYHLEGNNPSVSLTTMIDAVRQFCGQLIGLIQTFNPDEQLALTVRLFEDNGRETTLEGKPITFSSVFKEKFAWKELKSSVIPFVTTMLLIWLRLKQEAVSAAIYSILIVTVFVLADAVITYRRGRGKIELKLRES